jgi:hypothetical protein
LNRIDPILFQEETMTKFLGIVMIVLALTIAIVPVFTDCESHGRHLTTQDGRTVAMKCHWAGIAEIGSAVALGLAGIFSLRSRSRETTRRLAIIGVAAGAMAILFPTALIGVCANPMMPCNLMMLPTLVGAGILAMVASAALYLTAREPQIPITGAAA